MNDQRSAHTLPTILTRTSTRVSGLAYLAAALVMTQLPLLGSLGYESALAFGLIAGWIGGLVPLLQTRGEGAPPARGLADTFRAWLRWTLAGWLLLLLPVAVLVVNALFVRNCSMFDGMLFWLLIPFATASFTAALVLFLRELTGRRAGWFYYAVLLLLLFQPFVQIYTRPQLYAYNHVFGMFVGLSWDQSQPPFATLALYRLSTLAYAALLLLTAAALAYTRQGGEALRRARPRLLLLFLPVVAGVMALLAFADDLGFSNSEPHLRNTLGSVYRLGAVEIHYDSSAVGGDDLRFIAEEHAFQLERVCAALGVAWEGTLTSYLYPDRATKKRLLGTESSEIARPWRKEIHLSLQYWRDALKHEIVHVAAGSFGPYLNRAPFLRVLGLTEGLAMAVEWSWDDRRTLHQHAAAMRAYGLLPDVRACISTLGFVSNSSSVSYVASGSFTRWLMDTLGVAAVRRAYAEDDIESVTGLSYEELDARWNVFLAGVERRQPDSLATAYAFTRPSLFTALCPRVVTARSRGAAEALAEHRPAEALAMYRAVEQLAPGARAVFGIVDALYQLGADDSVRIVAGGYLADSARAASLLPLELWRGASAWRQRDSAAADRAFSVLVREQPAGWPTDLATRMRRALRRRPQDRALREVLLAALQREQNEDSLRGVRSALLGASAALQGTPDPVLAEEWTRLAADDSAGRAACLAVLARIPVEAMHLSLRARTGVLHYRQGEMEKAERMFRSALECADAQAARLQIEEWLARCAWKHRARRESAQQQHVQ